MKSKIYKEHYRVYEDGRMWSYKTNKWMTPRITKIGYVQVSPHRKLEYLHRIVAELFIPNPDNKRTVNHKNGIKTDNRVDNLEWATHSENIKHSFDELDRKQHNRLLTKEQVLEIKNSNEKQVDLAKKYKVKKNVISCIKNNRTYTNL